MKLALGHSFLNGPNTPYVSPNFVAVADSNNNTQAIAFLHPFQIHRFRSTVQFGAHPDAIACRPVGGVGGAPPPPSRSYQMRVVLGNRTLIPNAPDSGLMDIFV